MRTKKFSRFQTFFWLFTAVCTLAQAQFNSTPDPNDNTTRCSDPPDDEFRAIVAGMGRIENRVMQTANLALADGRVIPCFAENIQQFLKRRFFTDHFFLESGEIIEGNEMNFGASVQQYIENGGDPNARTTGGEPLLTAVARAHDTQSVEFLLQHGANIHQKDLRWERTALLATAETGAAQTAKILISHGANYSDTDIFGLNIVDIAAQNGSDEYRSTLRHNDSVFAAAPRSRFGHIHFFRGDHLQNVINTLVSFPPETVLQDVDHFLYDHPAKKFIASLWMMAALSMQHLRLFTHLLFRANVHLVFDNAGPAIAVAIAKAQWKEAALLAHAGAFQHLDSEIRNAIAEQLRDALQTIQNPPIIQLLLFIQTVLLNQTISIQKNIPSVSPKIAENTSILLLIGSALLFFFWGFTFWFMRKKTLAAKKNIAATLPIKTETSLTSSEIALPKKRNISSATTSESRYFSQPTAYVSSGDAEDFEDYPITRVIKPTEMRNAEELAWRSKKGELSDWKPAETTEIPAEVARRKRLNAHYEKRCAPEDTGLFVTLGR